MWECSESDRRIGLAQHAKARIIFCGDTSQTQSVEEGDALRILQKFSPLQSFALTAVQRQKNAAYREAVEQLRDDPQRGFDRLMTLNAVREESHLDLPRAVAEQYHTWPGDTLLVCPTHDEIARVTHEIRQVGKEIGALGDGRREEHYVPLNWTPAQQRQMSNYRPGQVLVFHRATRDAGKNEAVELTRVEPNAVYGVKPDGTQIQVTAKQAKAFSVFQKATIEVAPGDVLLLQARWNDHDLASGERVTVERIDAQGNKHLDDGRIVPAGYKQFTHGYAMTAQAAQGKTVDRVLICADEMSRELFYVAASRGRYECRIFTTDAEALRLSVTESSARTAATELALGMQALATMQRAQAHLDALAHQSSHAHGRTEAHAAPAQAAHGNAPAHTAAPEVGR